MPKRRHSTTPSKGKVNDVHSFGKWCSVTNHLGYDHDRLGKIGFPWSEISNEAAFSGTDITGRPSPKPLLR